VPVTAQLSAEPQEISWWRDRPGLSGKIVGQSLALRPTQQFFVVQDRLSIVPKVFMPPIMHQLNPLRLNALDELDNTPAELAAIL
jgi:hypothetical protein